MASTCNLTGQAPLAADDSVNLRALTQATAATGEVLRHLGAAVADLGQLEDSTRPAAPPYRPTDLDRAVQEAAAHLALADRWLGIGAELLQGPRGEYLDGADARARAARAQQRPLPPPAALPAPPSGRPTNPPPAPRHFPR